SELLIDTFPLLAYRIKTINQRFSTDKLIKNELERHQRNLDRNLLRIYRLRNEIVHSAIKDNSILDITSHLRYYLIFVINGFMDFVIKSPVDVNKDESISIDDYFLFSSIQLDSLLFDGTVTVKKLLEFNNPVDYLS
ncbi:MAG TPA: hypothetical protein VGM63_02105, partial [Mucilaginibacter sp.]